MQIGHSATDEIPAVDCTVVLPEGSMYEMIEMDGWHSVKPILSPTHSLMVIGERYPRKMPLEPTKELRQLTENEKLELMLTFVNFYVGNRI